MEGRGGRSLLDAVEKLHKSADFALVEAVGVFRLLRSCASEIEVGPARGKERPEGLVGSRRCIHADVARADEEHNILCGGAETTEVKDIPSAPPLEEVTDGLFGGLS